LSACEIDQDLLMNFMEVEEEYGPLPLKMQGFGKLLLPLCL